MKVRYDSEVKYDENGNIVGKDIEERLKKRVFNFWDR